MGCPSRSPGVLAVVAVVALSLTGCAESGTAPAAPLAPVVAAETKGTVLVPGSEASETSGAVTTLIQAVHNMRLGPLVAEGGGLTLYRFDRDTTSPSRPTCEGKCAEEWIPVTARGTLEFQGVDRSLIATVERADGTSQVTLGGWPLYRFAQDATGGETLGEGVDGAWFSIAPDGGKATESR